MPDATTSGPSPPIDLATLPARLDRLATPTGFDGSTDPTDKHLSLELAFLRQLTSFARQVMRADEVICKCFAFDSPSDNADAGGDNRLGADKDYLIASPAQSDPHYHSVVNRLADSAAQSLRTEVKHFEGLHFIATVARQQSGITVMISRLNLGDASIEPFVLTQQLMTSAIVTWHERTFRKQIGRQQELRQWTDELIGSIDASETWLQLTHHVVDSTAIHLQAHQVALCVGRRHTPSIMDVASVGGDGTRLDDSLWQLAAAETVLRQTTTAWPTDQDEDAHGDEDAHEDKDAVENDDEAAQACDEKVATIAHRRLAESVSSSYRAVSIPLRNEANEIFAVLVIVADKHRPIPDEELRWISTELSRRIRAWQQAHRSKADRLIGTLRQSVETKKGFAALSLAVAIAALVPIPYRVSGTATVVPRTRNFVVAPHAGLIRHVHVRVGDVVDSGTPIAELDDRELRIDLAALLAERDRAAKQRDVHRAAGDVAKEQLAEFELARVNEKIHLIQFRLDNLSVISPIDGVVLHGELEGVTGAAVETGQMLAEIASIDELWIEVDVPQQELAEIREGQPLRVRLDADVASVMEAKVDSISPSARVKDGENVFVVRASVDNPDRLLRPGITGRAKIQSDRRPLVAVALRGVWYNIRSLWF